MFTAPTAIRIIRAEVSIKANVFIDYSKQTTDVRAHREKGCFPQRFKGLIHVMLLVIPHLLENASLRVIKISSFLYGAFSG